MAQYIFNHENGTASEHSAGPTEAGGATIDVTAASAGQDTGYGLEVDFSGASGNGTAYYSSTGTITATDDRAVRLYLNLNTLGLGTGEEVWFFNTKNGGAYTEVFGLIEDSGEIKIRFHSRPTWTSNFSLNQTGWNLIETYYPNTGSTSIKINGVEVATPTKPSMTTTTVYVGALIATGSNITGSFYIDQVVYDDAATSLIGPYTGQPEGMITHEGESEGGTDGFEYDSMVNATNDITFVAAAALAGTGFGMQVVTNDTAEDYGVKNVALPVDSIYRVRFYFDKNTLSINSGQEQSMVRMVAGGTSQMIVGLWRTDPDFFLYCWTTNSFTVGTTPITSGTHYAEALIDMAAGTMDCSLDGSPEVNRTGHTSNTAHTALQVGSPYDNESGSTGNWYIDEIAWRPYNVEIGAWTANILDVDFETGAVTEKAGVETTEGATGIAVNPTAALKSSNFGAAFDLDANDDSYITYTLPGVAATTMRARFYFDLNTWADTDAAQVTGPLMFRESTNDQFGLKTEVNSGTETINGWYRTNSGTVQMTTETAVTSGWVEMEYCWHASAGYFKWWLDGVLQEEDTGLATDSVTVPDTVRLGWYTVGAGGDGVAYLDELIVRNQASSPIGTDGAGAGIVVAAVGGSPMLRFFK